MLHIQFIKFISNECFQIFKQPANIYKVYISGVCYSRLTDLCFVLQIVDVDVVSKSSEGVDVMVQPSGFPAFVPLEQLSDHPSLWEHLLSVYGPIAEGENSLPRRVPNVLFYGVTQKEGSVSSRE